MKNKIIFVACDTSNLNEIKKIINQTKTNKLNIIPKFGLQFFYSKQGRKFLEDGCKLKVTLMFRGRELARVDLGKVVMEKVIEQLSDIAEIEKDVPLEGRRMSMILNGK